MIVALCVSWPAGWYALAAFIIAVLPVGIPILKHTVTEWIHGDFFNEFTLMVIASIGAFCLGEYAEGVAVLLFYSVGEKLEDVVSGNVKGQIKRLLGKMPRHAVVIKDGERIEMQPEAVKPGMLIAVKPGEGVPLDGTLETNGEIDFNTSAITGESVPQTIGHGHEVSSGMIPVDHEAFIRVTNAWENSSMTRIMRMIEDASSHRAPSETILRRITRWYTPLVFACALLLVLIPWIVSLCSGSFTFVPGTWISRALVFLVCSCPCALIVSIPLTYFSSIGIASKKGILFKGHDSLDSLRNADTVLFDKTGTVTTGVFHVDRITPAEGFDVAYILSIAAATEQSSPHPLATAIVKEAQQRGLTLPEITEPVLVNHGMRSQYEGREILVGSSRLMRNSGIQVDIAAEDSTTVYVAVGGKLAGSITLADTVKPGAVEAVTELHNRGVKRVGILSGDAEGAVRKAAAEIGADFYKSGLVPADKQQIVATEKAEGHTVAFAGDGVNDGPALASASIGIAMGSAGTDIAIESAQVVIATDDLRKISEGIDISKRVKHVIIENVTFAFGVKLLVMALGAFGIATLWAAVFADTGVTVVTVLWTLYRLKIWQLKSDSRM